MPGLFAFTAYAIFCASCAARMRSAVLRVRDLSAHNLENDLVFLHAVVMN
jgi:hypothetical protein